jgi:hypothetical protein
VRLPLNPDPAAPNGCWPNNNWYPLTSRVDPEQGAKDDPRYVMCGDLADFTAFTDPEPRTSR